MIDQQQDSPPRSAPPDEPGLELKAESESWGWTRSHRIGLGILILLFLTLLFVQYLRRPIRMGEPLMISNGSATSLPVRIDPNTANVAELSRIPHIGPKLAEAIVKYRDARQSVAADGIVYARIEDIDRVPGVGKALLAQIRPYLDFPEAASEPASSPADH